MYDRDGEFGPFCGASFFLGEMIMAMHFLPPMPVCSPVTACY
jgi:hypothetical protein